jgi:hypothetical protein
MSIGQHYDVDLDASSYWSPCGMPPPRSSTSPRWWRRSSSRRRPLLLSLLTPWLSDHPSRMGQMVGLLVDAGIGIFVD